MKKYIICIFIGLILLSSCQNDSTIQEGSIIHNEVVSEVDTNNNGEINVDEDQVITSEEKEESIIGFRPEVFLSSVISVDDSKEATSMYAVSLGEFYFSRVDKDINNGLSSIWKTPFINGEWQEPELFIFSEDSKNVNPYVTPDEQYFLFYRTYNSETDDKKNGTYFLERTPDGWLEPKFLIDEYCVTTVDFETFYASPIKGQYKNDLIQFEYIEGEVRNLKPLLGGVNTNYIETHPVVAPDGTYIIYDTNNPDSINQGDMLISFKVNNQTWSEGINLGESVNNGLSSNPSISTDSTLLFFSSNDDIYSLPLKEMLIVLSPSVYFNQKLPMKTPEVFAKDIVSKSDSLQYPVSFSHDTQLMIYGQMDANRNRQLMYSERSAEDWTEPETIRFTNGDEMEPIISPDGNRIYFTSSQDTNLQKPSDLYYVTYSEGIFSKPIKLPDTINTDKTEYYVSQSINGNLYFTREGVGIFKSEFTNGNYQEAQKLDFDSSYYYVSHPFIAKDESYVLFDARYRDNFGSADLFISFNSENGFSKPINLGEKINTEDWDAMASLSPDEKYLFFVREEANQRNVFWIEFNAEDYR